VLHSPTLTELVAEESNLCRGGMSMRGAEALLGALLRNPRVLQLELGGNLLTPKVQSRIADSLKVNRSLGYDSHKELERHVASRMPAVPVFEERVEPQRVPLLDEAFLEAENVRDSRVFRIDPEVEVIRRRKRNVQGDRPGTASPEAVATPVARRGLAALLRGGGKVPIARPQGKKGQRA
jgi:hypothetical protein